MITRSVAARPSRVWRQVLHAVAGVVLVGVVSGCGLVGVRLSDEAGAPLRLGAQPTMGPEPEPTETQDPALADQSLEHLTFSGNCPARVTIHVPQGWTGNLAATSYNALPAAGGFDGPRLSVSCSEAYGSSASDAVASSQRYQFTDSDTTVLAERTGQAGPGYFWTYQADLGANETLGTGGESGTSAIGSNVAYPIAGKVYEIRFIYYFSTDDSATRDLAAASIANVTVEGTSIGAPTWSDDSTTGGDDSDDDSGDDSDDD